MEKIKEYTKVNWLRGLIALIALTLLCLFATSCMTNRKGELTEKGVNFVAEHCKGYDSTSKKDITVTTIDTVKIPYPVQGPIIYLENPCKVYCDSIGNLKPFWITKKTNGITNTVKSVGNTIAFDCKTDSLMYVIETQKRTIQELQKSKVVIQEPCKKEHCTKWDGFTYWWFWITAVLLALVISFKFFKIKIPFIK